MIERVQFNSILVLKNTRAEEEMPHTGRNRNIKVYKYCMYTFTYNLHFLFENGI